MQKISIALAKESVSKAPIDASSYEDFINEFKQMDETIKQEWY